MCCTWKAHDIDVNVDFISKFQSVSANTYSGAKKYLVSHQLCKFSHLKRWERPVIFNFQFIHYERQNEKKKYQKITLSDFIIILKNLFANYGGK